MRTLGQRQYRHFFLILVVVYICLGGFCREASSLTPEEAMQTAIDYMTHTWSCSTTVLFGVALEFQSELDNNNVSGELRQKFADNGILLSSNVRVLVGEDDARWLVDNTNKVYIVRKEGELLNIYATENIYHGWDGSKWIDTPDVDTSMGDNLGGWFRIDEDNIGIPYKWGGFSSITEFDEGIGQGRYAGDICFRDPVAGHIYPSGSPAAVA